MKTLFLPKSKAIILRISTLTLRGQKSASTLNSTFNHMYKKDNRGWEGVKYRQFRDYVVCG